MSPELTEVRKRLTGIVTGATMGTTTMNVLSQIISIVEYIDKTEAS